jgi:hypothetical protein
MNRLRELINRFGGLFNKQRKELANHGNRDRKRGRSNRMSSSLPSPCAIYTDWFNP